MKPYLLKLHRWLTLVFAAPLAALVVTGLILSFEPISLATSRAPGALTVERVQAILAKHDAEGKARGLAFRPYDGALQLMGGPTVDMATGEAKAPGALSRLYGATRGLHENLIFDLDWLVTPSTIAMCVIALLGLLMGLPRALRNTASGWHKATAWFLSPLVILAPLTGLALAYGITFAPSMARPAASAPPANEAPAGARPRRGGPALPLAEAVRLVGQEHDLSNLIWLRQRGPNLLARLEEGGEARVYAVSAQGLTPAPRNIPRLMHEGNWAGVWSGLINVVASIALLILLGTGLFIWAKRRLRKPQRQRVRPAPAE
jgi:uncharacterized iron-regulated membrane protein